MALFILKMREISPLHRWKVHLLAYRMWRWTVWRKWVGLTAPGGP